MARFDRETIARWSNLADAWILRHATVTAATRMDIKQGATAWAVASRCGICDEAYADRSVVDAHIQTALEKVFPNAVFRDAKRY